MPRAYGFSEAIRLDPNDADGYYNRGTIYGLTGKPEKAIVDFTVAIRLDPNVADVYPESRFGHTRRRVTTIRHSQTSRTTSASIRKTPRAITAAVWPTRIWGNTTRHWRTPTRRSASTRKSRRHTTAAALFTGTRASTTRRLPTSLRRFASPQHSLPHTLTAVLPTGTRASKPKWREDFDTAKSLGFNPQ